LADEDAVTALIKQALPPDLKQDIDTLGDEDILTARPMISARR
jgi:hypothetical protein